MTFALLANSHEAMDYVLAGVAFTNMPENGLPEGGIAYKLRFPSLWRQVVAGFNDWRTNMEYPEDQDQGPREPRDDTGGDPRKLYIRVFPQYTKLALLAFLYCLNLKIN